MRRRAVFSEYRELAIPPWQYLPTEPMGVVASYCDDGSVLERRAFDRVADALSHFARFHVGPIINRNVAVFDAEMQIVVGYRCEDEEHVEWYGTGLAFEILELFADRASVILWTAQAHGDVNRALEELR
jgi:hypothetical protein